MWSSTNKIYRYAIGLPVLFIMILFVIRFHGEWLPVLITIIMSAFLLYTLYNKTKCIPYPMKQYGNLEPVNLALPRDYRADVFFSNYMGGSSQSARIAELISPIRFEQDRARIIINPILYRKLGAEFFSIAVTREIEKYRMNYQLKVLLRLLLPILSAVILSLTAWLGNWFNLVEAPTYLMTFLLPFLYMVSFVIHIFTWNQSITRMDHQLDRLLTSYFSIRDVETYIFAVEDFERGTEKPQHKNINEHYRSERIKRLREAEGV